jgi:parallel beta-helix repeat protein
MSKMLIFVLLIAQFGLNFNNKELKSLNRENGNIINHFDYGFHSSISITSNNEFSTQGFSGSGTVLDPYKLNNVNISSATGTLISIQNTDVYFEIKNSYIDGLNTSYWGIYFNNVSHGFIENNTIKNNGASGIYVISSSHNLIVNNTISHNALIYDRSSGIEIRQSNNNIIENNSVFNQVIGHGLFFSLSNHNIVQNNTVYNNHYMGFRFDNSINLTISKNTIFSHLESGLSLYYVSSSNLTDNIVYKSNWSGISIEYSDQILIAKNLIYNNIEDGISIFSTFTSFVTLNSIYNNSWGGIKIGSSNFNSVSDNHVFQNLGDGINLYITFNNSLYLNEVNNNTLNGIKLGLSDSDSIISNLLYNNKYGLTIDHSKNNTVSKNIAKYNNVHGIELVTSINSLLVNNTAYNNTISGINIFESSENNLITNNTVYSNLWAGIGVIRSNSNKINLNLAYDNYFGIFLRTSKNNTVVDNYINNNEVSAILLYLLTNNNTINSNTLSDNGVGIYIIESPNNTLDNNILIHNSIKLEGDNATILIQESVKNNFVNGKPFIFWQNVTSSTVPENSGGVILLNSTNIDVKNLHIDNSSFGIQIISSNKITIQNNTILNGITGIHILNSNANFLINNAVENNLFKGILIENSSLNRVENNTVISNKDLGISLILQSNNNTIKLNKIINNQHHGISISEKSKQNLVKNNQFYSNNQGGSQAYDNGTFNEFILNYWNDWVAPDSDNNGIVDIPYIIEGTIFNYDNYPVIISNSIQIIFPPNLQVLKSSQIIHNEINLTWTPATDLWDLNVKYNLYYSENGGTTWDAIISGLENTNYLWIIKNLPDGSNYILLLESVNTNGLNINITSVIFTIDNTPPNIQLLSPVNTTYTNSTITINITGDAVNYWFFIETVDNQNQSWSEFVTRNLLAGSYIIHVFGNDSVGNINSLTVNFEIKPQNENSSSIIIITTTTSKNSYQNTSKTTEHTVIVTNTPGFTWLLTLLGFFILNVTKNRFLIKNRKK